jgi:hypothetical protein
MIQQKSFRTDNPFYSDIEIQSIPSGLRATVSACAIDVELAYKAAVFFFGRMLDVLTLNINRPMYLSLGEGERVRGPRHDVRRLIESHQINEAFHEAHQLETTRQSFLRALGWYRKGLFGTDPFNKFLAFWNAVETVAAKYYQDMPAVDNERAKRGSKSQLWECFKALWGSVDEWPIISGQGDWIDKNYSSRIGIAHGVTPIDVHTVAEVVGRLKTIEPVAYKFLRDWHDRFLYITPEPEAFNLVTVNEELSVQ